MSRRNVEIGKRLNEAFNRGEVEAGLAYFSPEAELRDLLNAPGQDPVVQGTDRIREVLFLWTSVFDELRVEVSERSMRATLGVRSRQARRCAGWSPESAR